MNKKDRQFPGLFEIPDFAWVKTNRLPYPSKQFDTGWFINEAIDERPLRIEKFTEVIEIDGGNALSWFNRGRAFFESKNYARAIQDFDEAIKLDPTGIQFYDIRAIAYCYLNQLEDALDAYNLASGVQDLTKPRTVEVTWQIERLERNRLVLLELLDARQQERRDDLIKQKRLIPFAERAEALVRERKELAEQKSVELDRRWFRLQVRFIESRKYSEAILNLSEGMYDGSFDEAANALLTKGLSASRLATYKKAWQEKKAAAAIYYQRPKDDSTVLTKRERFIASYENLVFEETKAIIELAAHGFYQGDFDEPKVVFRTVLLDFPSLATSVAKVFEKYLLWYYDLPQEDNPSNGYDLPRRVITEDKLREIIRDEAALFTERLGQPADQPFPILPEGEVKAIIAHGKKHQWNERTDYDWPYHTNAFKFLHITYNRWINRGITREILAQADPSLHTHITRKISLEGLPPWLDLPTGAEAKLRSIDDPDKRTKLENVREFLRDQKRSSRGVAPRPRGRPKKPQP